ncbi:MAG: hypothetical protein JJE28_05240 [Actinomycetales bacterium]|nr:hypothetical protein [Actinomycetales bacterium]
MRPRWTKLIDDNITEQGAIWDQAEPSWNAAFDTIRAAFEECRSTDGQTTSRCARTLGFQLQVAHAESVLADLDARIVAVADLPVEEQEVALAELEAERFALLARLDRASAKLVAATSESTPGADASTQARLNAVAGQLRNRGAEDTTPGAVDPEVATSDQQTPETGSVTIEKAPRNSGNSGQNAPANPGSNGNVPENPGNSGNRENSGNNKR